MTHCRTEVENPRSRRISGSATATIVTSRTTTNCATQSSASGADFANTVRRVGRSYQELLRSGADVASWAALEGGRVPPVDARAAGDRLEEIRAVRDDVFAVLTAASRGDWLPAVAAGRINARLRALPVAQLVVRPGEAGVHITGAPEPVDELLARVTAATVDLAASSDSGLAFCDAPSCGQFFIRRRTNQRFCDASCGTRTRVARHAAHRH